MAKTIYPPDQPRIHLAPKGYSVFLATKLLFHSISEERANEILRAVKRLLKRGVPVAEVPARLKTIKKRKKRSVNDQKRKPKSPKPFPEAVSEAFIDSEQQEHQSELDTFVHQDSPDCYHIESEAVLNAMPSQSYRTLTVSPGVVLSARVVSRILDVLKPDGQLKILSLHKGGK